MLGRTEKCVENGKPKHNKVLAGAIRKTYFQRLRPQSHRLRHGTGSIKYVDHLRLDLVEQEILRIRSFGVRLVDVLTKPFRNSTVVEQHKQQQAEPGNQERKAFTQYVTQQEEEDKTKNTTSALSPFVTKQQSNTSGFSWFSSLWTGLASFDARASWKRTPITTLSDETVRSGLVPPHTTAEVQTHQPQHQDGQTHQHQHQDGQTCVDTRFSSVSAPATGLATFSHTSTLEQTPVETQEQKPSNSASNVSIGTSASQQEQMPQLQAHVATSSTSTNTLQAQNVVASTPIDTAAPPGEHLVPSVKIHVSAHTVSCVPKAQTNNSIRPITNQKQCCSALHCASAHWHEASTIRNPFESRQSSPIPSSISPASSVRSDQPHITSRKRSYQDYDSDEEYYSQSQYPKRPRYHDTQDDEINNRGYARYRNDNTDAE